MLEKVLQFIQSHDDFAITSHIRPDGDALGSELALLLTLEAAGKKAVVLNRDPMPERYLTLPGADRVRVTDRVEGKFAGVFVLECGSLARTGLQAIDRQTLVNIDHHHLTENYAALNWIDESACAVGEMVYRIAKGLGIAITPAIATNIYTAVVTDTGSFQFPSTTAATFRMAAELADCGADVSGIARSVFYSNPLTKVNSMMVMLNRMQLDCGGRLVWTAVTRDDMVRYNCMGDDVEGLVNFPLTISGVDVAVFFRELENATFRVSLRSKNSIDVCAIASEFGGGGHRNAAGFTLAGTLERSRDAVLSRVKVSLSGNGRPDGSEGH